MTKYSSAGEVIEKIVQDHGMDTLLDTQLTMAIFSDIAPMMRTKKDLLRVFLECDGAKKIISAINRPIEEQQCNIESLIKKMHEDCWIALDAAQYICAEFYRGVTGCEWVFGQSKTGLMETNSNLDVYRSVTIKNVDRKSKLSVSVDVDGKKIDVPMPDHIVNGQTICFPEKGKSDPTTGKTGDLYITIHLNGGVSNKLLVAILASTLFLLVAILLLKNIGEKETPINMQHPVENTSFFQQTEHVHTWREATCLAPKTCDTCGATEGPILDHIWSEATCTQPLRCEVCGETVGEPLGHVWMAATFTTAKTCTVCGGTEGSPIDYSSISVEDEVLSIREKYNAIVSEISAGIYRKENLRKGVDAYYNEESELICVIVYRGTDGIGNYSKTYSRSYYFENDKLFFAFYEGYDSHRLYFYDELLMRWRFTGYGAKAVNHDFDFTEEYFFWEKTALTEIETFK